MIHGFCKTGSVLSLERVWRGSWVAFSLFNSYQCPPVWYSFSGLATPPSLLSWWSSGRRGEKQIWFQAADRIAMLSTFRHLHEIFLTLIKYSDDLTTWHWGDTMTEDFRTGAPCGLVLCTQLLQFVAFLVFQCQSQKKKEEKKGKH